ncbi:glucose dehydrogenase [Elizabethkingia anophelis]|nr:glucose dehydrogenase [Elizabethkingia anophelis]MCW2466942.1 glucose dehydrogenase [Elizabethkingia anophelis]MCW2470910.1 glucose dehydrogenase [Elizabethkingia anophelis]
MLNVGITNEKSINFQKLASLIMEFSNKELIYLGVLPVFLITGLVLFLYSCWLIYLEKNENNKLMLFIISILIPIAGPIFSIYTLKKIKHL